MKLVEIPNLSLIHERLSVIFPEGTEHRNYLIREMAAKTIFVLFYASAIEGEDRWVRPSQVTDMTDEQSNIRDSLSREAWVTLMLSNKKKKPENTWYASNSREPIRDETLRTGLVPLQAVIVRQGIPTTSSKPIYSLQSSFAKLFSSSIIGIDLDRKIEEWQNKYMSKAARTRFQLIKGSASAQKESVSITFPDGSIRTLESGPSSIISKAVIEEFAPRFLKQPKVLWLSGSKNKVVAQDNELAKSLGLNIDVSKALPDIILIDIGDDESGADMLVVFAEVVASDGPIDRYRKEILTNIADNAGFEKTQLAFMTAFLDRSSQPFKKSIPDLAWGSYAWFTSEPDYILNMKEHAGNIKLSSLK